MQNITEIYEDRALKRYVFWLAQKNGIDYQDLRQDVIIAIIESSDECTETHHKIARRVADKQAYINSKTSAVSYSDGVEYSIDAKPERHYDGSSLSFDDQMVCDLIGEFQPMLTRGVYKSKLYINGETL